VHEDGGYELPGLARWTERVAELVRDHGSWQRPDASWSCCWSASPTPYGRTNAGRISSSWWFTGSPPPTGQEPWQIFADLDELVTAIGSRAVQSLAYQNAYGTR
jgi:hypothetical protein